MPEVDAKSGRPASPYAPRISGGGGAIRFGRTLLVIGGIYCCALSSFAQTPDSTTTDQRSSWTATTESKSDNPFPTRLPVRISESHSQNGDRTLDKRSVEIYGTDKHFEPYQDIEKETLQVDATTVRTVTRTFSRDVNEKRSLVQVTEEEKQILPGGDSNIVRMTYNPDVNGKLQPVQREIVESKKIGEDLRETKTTVMLTNINGGLAPAFKTRELRRQAANDTVETEKTTLLPDLNGKWQLSEIRQSVATPEADGRRVEEKVFRPDAEGKLSQISRVVSHEAASPTGEKRSTEETYSVDVPGTTRDGKLHLIQRASTSSQSDEHGGRAEEQRVEQLNPGDPGAGLRISIVVNGKVVPVPPGKQSTVTIQARDLNGRFDTVYVDMTKSDPSPTIEIQQPSPEQPK